MAASDPTAAPKDDERVVKLISDLELLLLSEMLTTVEEAVQHRQ
jgi:hypothetical protein